MAYTIPSKQAASELQRTHERTFAIEIKRDAPFVLYLKLTPTQTLSVINGAPIQLIIGSPTIQPNAVTFRLYDILESPFWITREFEASSDSNTSSQLFAGLPTMSQYLANATEAYVALFDWNTRCIHSERVSISKPKQTLHEWYKKNQSLFESADKLSEDKKLEYGYVLDFGILQKEPNNWYDIAYGAEVGAEPYIVSTNKYSDYLSTSNYLIEGRHGYYQEQVLALELYKYFDVNFELFLSPRLRDKTELSDFVLASNGLIVLIESKASRPYNGSPRKSSSVERSLTKLVHKAFEQLLKAQEIVTRNPVLLEDVALFKHCVYHKEVVSICIVDDALMINTRSLQRSLRQLSDKVSEGSRPYIVELEDFIGLLWHSPSRMNILYALADLAHRVPLDADLPLLSLGFR